MKICICIPCVDKHIPLLNKFLETIPKFTYIPDEVCISLSPKFDKTLNLDDEKNKLMQKFSNLNLKILVQDKITQAAMNLNKLSEIAESDILVRCDADDIIHPQKLEIIKTIFEKYPDTKLLLHAWFIKQHRDYSMSTFSFIDISNLDNEIYNDIQTFKIMDLKSEKYSKKFNKNIDFIASQNLIVNGANAVHKCVFNDIKYPDQNYGEDKRFNYALTNHFNKTIFLNLKLMHIIGSGTWR
tara:strand:- start:3935 stop:4657 length:723 start_codon:yes stop_codon:yes gene_type:complete